MRTERLVRLLLVLLVIIAGFYVIEKAWDLLGSIKEIIVIFGLGWLVAYVLEPAVMWLAQLHAPGWVRKLLTPSVGARVAQIITNFRMGRIGALAIVYLALVAGIILTALYLVPLLVEQLTQLSAGIPGFLSSIPKLLASADVWLAEHNIAVSLANLYDQFLVRQRAEALLGQAVQYSIGAARAILSIVGASLLVLAVSFYMMLDGRKLLSVFSSLVPNKYQDEIAFASNTIDQVFGGFVRGQALMAIISAAFAFAVALIAGLPSAVLIGWLSGLLMLVPLVGAPIAMVLPAVTALFTNPEAALWLFIVVTVFQQIELEFIIPRLMSEAMGLPTLLVVFATLLGVALLGFWGLVFGVPMVAVLYALAVYFLRRMKKQMDSGTEGEPP